MLSEEELNFLNENTPFEACPDCFKANWKSDINIRFLWECQNCSNAHVGVYYKESYLKGYWAGYKDAQNK